MRQRLGLAAALLAEPELLILDEPANGLDPAGIRWLRELLRSFVADGGAVFLSSHLLAEVAQMADKVVVVQDGRLVAHTSVEALTAGAARAVRVRSPEADGLADLLLAAGAEGTGRVDDFAVVGPAAPQDRHARLRRLAVSALTLELDPTSARRLAPLIEELEEVDEQASAAAHEAAQRARGARVEPARVAGEDHAAMVCELRSLAARQRHVGGEVVAAALAVELGEQQRLVAADLRRDAVADVRARELHRQARRKRVGPAVALVVDGVEPLPGRHGQDDEHVARPARLDDDGCSGLACARADLEEVQARLAAGRGEAHHARARAAAAVADPRAADAPQLPREALAGRFDGDGGGLARLDGGRRRLRAQVAHRDAAAARQRAPVLQARRHRRRGADVAGPVT
ncbi:MAG: AAA family ATPase [Actinobacteria bacterium]|nr:AAA family ATPase [Actinomycetota bacterium]